MGFYENEKAHTGRGPFFRVWVLLMSRYRAGGLLEEPIWQACDKLLKLFGSEMEIGTGLPSLVSTCQIDLWNTSASALKKKFEREPVTKHLLKIHNNYGF